MQWYYKPLILLKERQKSREVSAKEIIESSIAPNFILPTIDNKQFILVEHLGKTLILDFWGAWCHWCIKGVPKMIDYYKKYKEKIEVIGIDCSDKEDDWKNAVEKYKKPWIHVRQSINTEQVSDKYGIRSFPTKVIINPDGTINKVFRGETTEFYTYLDELFK